MERDNVITRTRKYSQHARNKNKHTHTHTYCRHSHNIYIKTYNIQLYETLSIDAQITFMLRYTVWLLAGIEVV